MKAYHIHVNIVEGSFLWEPSSHCGQAPILLQTLRNFSIPRLLPVSARDSNYRLVKFLLTSDRRWKRRSFSSSQGSRLETLLGRDPFPPYIGKMGNLHPKDMLVFTTHFTSFVISI